MIKRNNGTASSASGKGSAKGTAASAAKTTGSKAVAATVVAANNNGGGASSKSAGGKPKRLTIGTLKARTGDDGTQRQFLVLDKQIGLTFKGEPVTVSFNTAHFRDVDSAQESVNFLEENGYISAELATKKRDYLSNEDIVGLLEVQLEEA